MNEWMNEWMNEFSLALIQKPLPTISFHLEVTTADPEVSDHTMHKKPGLQSKLNIMKIFYFFLVWEKKLVILKEIPL